MRLSQVDVLDRRARGKVVAEFPRLGFGSENLNWMRDVETKFHLRMKYNLILPSQSLLNPFTGTRIPSVRPPNILRLIHQTGPVSVNSVQEFLP